MDTERKKLTVTCEECGLIFEVYEEDIIKEDVTYFYFAQCRQCKDHYIRISRKEIEDVFGEFSPKYFFP